MTNDKLADEIQSAAPMLHCLIAKFRGEDQEGRQELKFGEVADALQRILDAAFRAERQQSMEDDVPLCAGHADWWFTSRNHLKGDTSCVVCAFNPERPPSGEMAIRNDECWEIIKALDAEGKASSLIGYPLTDTNRTTIRAWLQSRIEGRKLAAAEAERGKAK